MCIMKILNSVYYFIGSFFGRNEIPSEDLIFIKNKIDNTNIKNRDGNNNNLSSQTIRSNQNSNQTNISMSSCFKILNDEMLSDNEIYLASELLKKQFQAKKNIQGLFDPQALNTKLAKRKILFHVEYPNKFIQILHDGDMHWFTITNVKSNQKYQIQSYDSYFMTKTYLGNSKFEDYLRKLMVSPSQEQNLDQSVQIIDNKNDNIYVECSVEPVKMQTCETICGLYAIAFAYDLCMGNDPSKQNYDEEKMRKHLFKCLNQNYFEPFPIEKTCEPYKMTQSQILFVEITN